MVDEPAHYRWSGYRNNALGQANPLLTSHARYLSLNAKQELREASYRALFAGEIDAAQIIDTRAALPKSQPLGNSRFADTIERMTGERGEVRPSGRPRRMVEAVEEEVSGKRSSIINLIQFCSFKRSLPDSLPAELVEAFVE